MKLKELESIIFEGEQVKITTGISLDVTGNWGQICKEKPFWDREIETIRTPIFNGTSLIVIILNGSE